MTSLARSERVGGLIQQLLSELLRRDISAPPPGADDHHRRQGDEDLRLARVYFATAGGKSTSDAAAEGFASAAGFIKRRLAGQLGRATCPRSSFFTMRPLTTAPTSTGC